MIICHILLFEKYSNNSRSLNQELLPELFLYVSLTYLSDRVLRTGVSVLVIVFIQSCTL